MGGRTGFSLIEMLIVVTVLGLLASLILGALGISRKKAYDNSIRNGVRQLRLLAEQVYDTQGASYLNWSQHSSVRNSVQTLRADIDKSLQDTDSGSFLSVIRENQKKDYCVSAPLRSVAGKHYCVDATAVFATTGASCPEAAAGGPALRCPAP